LRSIVRRDTGESYQDFLTKLAQASGIETPTRADLARVDRKRKKKGSNDDWAHPHDPDAKISPAVRSQLVADNQKRAVHRFEYSSSSLPNVAASLSGLHSFCFDPNRCNQPEHAERRGNDGGPILPPRQTRRAVAEMPIPDPKNLSADGPAIADEHGDEHSHD
jgi:hypothetical protein